MKAFANGTAQNVETPPELSDFPDWLSPMLVKELRQGLRTRAFVLSLTALHVAMVLILANGLARIVDGLNADSVGTLFWGCVYLLLLAGISLRAINGLHAERSLRTLELLSAAGVSGTRLAFGKWVALMVQGALMTVSVAPYFVMRYYLGSVDLMLEAKLLFVSFLLAGVCAAFCIAASVGNLLFRSAAAAGIGLGTLIFWGGMTALVDNAENLAKFNRMGFEWMAFFGMASLAVTLLLRLAGDAIDTPAHNGAVLPRALLVVGWSFVFVPGYERLVEGFQISHLFLMGTLTCVAFFWHLHGNLGFRENQLRPFARLGLIGRPLALLFSPNWVGTLWLPPLALFSLMHARPDREFLPFFWLLGANLLSGVLVWRLFFKRNRDPKGCLLLYWASGGVIAALAYALGARSHLAWTALIPPVGIWQYTGAAEWNKIAAEWTESARSSCLVHLLLCSFTALFWIRASKEWTQAFSKPNSGKPV